MCSSFDRVLCYSFAENDSNIIVDLSVSWKKCKHGNIWSFYYLWLPGKQNIIVLYVIDNNRNFLNGNWMFYNKKIDHMAWDLIAVSYNIRDISKYE